MKRNSGRRSAAPCSAQQTHRAADAAHSLARSPIASPPKQTPCAPQNAQYGDAAYWDERYAREPVCFDWYRGYDGLASVLLRHLDPAAPLLHVGMGTSQLQRDLVERAGFKRVVNVDVSGVAVAWMRGLHDGVKGLEYRVGDVR